MLEGRTAGELARSGAEPFACFGGLGETTPSGRWSIVERGEEVGSPTDPVLAQVARYLIDAAEHHGLVDGELRELLDGEGLSFRAGQIFFTRGEIEEIRLELIADDGETTYGTRPRPQLEATPDDPESLLELDPSDEGRFHLSAFFDESEGGRGALILAWDVEGHVARGEPFVAAQARVAEADETRLVVPVGPTTESVLRAIFHGRTRRWETDDRGRPVFRFRAEGGRVDIFFDAPEVAGEAALAAMMLAVQELDVETADVFLILLGELVKTRTHGTETAHLTLERMAEMRSVRFRQGSESRLQDDLLRAVLNLANIRLSMSWQDPDGGTVTFGVESPDRLFDIVDWTHEQRGKRRSGFSFRGGQAITHFMKMDSARWIGYYSRALLGLSPYHDAWAKRLGTVWLLLGQRDGGEPTASLGQLLEFIGEEVNRRNPGRTVDAIINAHLRLEEIGLLDEVPLLEPPDRDPGYIDRWLAEPRTVRLSDSLLQLARGEVRSRRGERVLRQSPGQTALPIAGTASAPMPLPSIEQIRADRTFISRCRRELGLRQQDLAEALALRRETVSRVETGKAPVSWQFANALREVWKERRKKVGGHGGR